MQELLKIIAQGLVEKPEEVSVTTQETDSEIVCNLKVADTDMGRVIGKQGRIAKAIRTLMRSAATKQNKKISVEIG